MSALSFGCGFVAAIALAIVAAIAVMVKFAYDLAQTW